LLHWELIYIRVEKNPADFVIGIDIKLTYAQFLTHYGPGFVLIPVIN